MIRVEDAESYRMCNSCGSNRGVINVTTIMQLRYSQQGNQIALCKDCAKTLRDELNRRYPKTEETK